MPDECEAIGDYDGDGNVDLDDYAQWDACVTGPNAGPLTLGCESFDLDTDELLDFLITSVGFILLMVAFAAIAAALLRMFRR